MTHSHIHIPAWCLAWLLSVAATPVASARSLSLEEALSLADQESALVRRARAERVIAGAGRVNADILFPSNPVLSVQAGHRWDTSGSDVPSTGAETAVRLEQAIEVAGQRGLRIAEVDRYVEAALSRERYAIVENHARVKSAYIGTLLAANFLDSAKKREAVGQQIVNAANASERVGAASEVDRNLALVERGRLLRARAQAELGFRQAELELKRLLGIPDSEAITLTTSAQQAPDLLVSLAELQARANAARQDAMALENDASALSASIVRLRREVAPNPTIFLDFAHQALLQNYVGAGVAVPLPVWRRNQGAIATAQAQLQNVEQEKLTLSRSIALEVASAYQTFVASKEEAVVWSKDVLPSAEANIELITKGWQAGAFDMFRVIQASRELGEARLSELEILGALWRASIEIQRATGEP